MKNHTLLKQFHQMLSIGIIMALTALVSSVATMHYLSSLPADKWEYMQMEQRWANWPEKDCYDPIELEMIILGP